MCCDVVWCGVVWCKGCGGIVGISCYHSVSENKGDGDCDDLKGAGQGNHHQITLMQFIQNNNVGCQNNYHISIIHDGTKWRRSVVKGQEREGNGR